MPRKNRAHPFAAYAWLTEASWVFVMHSAQLWADPAKASGRLAVLGAEKQKAFAEGAIKASAAAIRGAKPNAIAKAAMAPARRRVRANARKIQKG
jgi:high-affinity K+ transport system ATPase subunit B